jgi:hypothetical protein
MVFLVHEVNDDVALRYTRIFSELRCMSNPRSTLIKSENISSQITKAYVSKLPDSHVVHMQPGDARDTGLDLDAQTHRSSEPHFDKACACEHGHMSIKVTRRPKSMTSGMSVYNRRKYEYRCKEVVPYATVALPSDARPSS